MNEAESKVLNEKTKEKVFSKRAFINSKKYNRDVLNALLEDERMYSEKEVKGLVEKYLKGRVM